MPSAQSLTDHDAIREWAEAHGATPARVARTAETNEPEGLGFDFHIAGAAPAEPIGWDEWFEDFDRRKVALLVETNTREPSTFHKLVPRSERRVHTGAARRRRKAPGGNQPIGARAKSADKKPARAKPVTPHRAPQPSGGRGRRRGSGQGIERRSEARGKSVSKKPASSPRKSSGRSGRARRGR